jgi:GH43 family beta-xylosidase
MPHYTNPVHPDYFADPFIWRHEGVYYAVGTGAAEAHAATDEVRSPVAGDERRQGVFPLLRSDDFVTWSPLGRVMARPDPALGDAYWAPEIASEGGLFHLYYSVGHGDRGHQLRVATSPRPEGPYEDAGLTLLGPPGCPFAIDPHPFRDDDGTWYLFYARDFLDAEGGARAGTALAVRRLEGMARLADEEHVVLRATFDWQRFLRDRPMYGQVFDWHTLEGPCVRKHAGRYWCFYSGGRWETEGYGVDYGVADSVLGPYSPAGAEAWARVLRSVAGRALGPGHNSVAVGPDAATEYVVYHAWDPAMTARRMCLDRLLWTEGGPRCAGPTWEPQQVPAA